MIHRRHEGEWHRVGFNWQWDRWQDNLWMALAFRTPYWLSCFTTWYDPLYGEDKVVSLQKNLRFGLAYAKHSRKFHWYCSTYESIWKEFNAR